MIKTILLPVSGSTVDSSTFGAAVDLARRFSGHIDFLYAHTESVVTGSIHGEAFVPQMLEQLRSAADHLHERSMQAHLDACAREGIPTVIDASAIGKVTASWHRETGSIEARVAAYGHASDLIVARRPEGDGVLAAQALDGALFGSGRPVLVPGPLPISLDTIAIAWKPTREAARAVSAAMPILEQAKRLVIVSVSETPVVDRNGAERLATNLRRHYPAMTVQTAFLEPESFDVAEALFTHADLIEAGVLVMGAYSHSRMRELILGGVTESLLSRSGISLFMAH